METQPAGTEPKMDPDPHVPMLDPDAALRLVLEAVTQLEPVELRTEVAVGTVLAETIVADSDYPPFDRSMMDGFAVRLADAGREVAVVGEVVAGGASTDPLPSGAVVAIMTGAQCPQGTEAVVPVEDVADLGGSVRLPLHITPQQNVAARGSECTAGTAVLHAGRLVTPLRLGLLRAVGRTAVRVRPPPTLAVISTGDELVFAGAVPGPGQIRASNGAMLAAMATAAGAAQVRQSYAGDDPEALGVALEQAAGHDVIVLTGGVSAGRYDLVPAAIAAWGGTTVFHGVRQKPGKPMLFATRDRTLVFGLPGNPLAAHLGFHRYVRAALLALMGIDPRPTGARGRLRQPVTVAGSRTVFQLCQVDADDDGWAVTPLAGRGSADVFTAAAANAIVRLEPDGGPYLPGDEVSVEWLGEAPPGPVRPGGRPEHTDLLAPIAARRSLRDFESGPVPPVLLRRMFEAARWAPSSGNGQPWRFVITDNGSPAFDRLVATLRPRNDWARAAPHLVLVAAKRMYEHPTKPPKHNRFALLETGLSLGNLMVQGTADGVLVHALDGFDEVAAGEAVGVPEGFEVTVMLAVGMLSTVPMQSGVQAGAGEPTPRQRLPLVDLVFRERWGEDGSNR